MKAKLSIFAWGLIYEDENYLKNVTFSPIEAGGMNISPDCVAEAQLAACRSINRPRPFWMRLINWFEWCFWNKFNRVQIFFSTRATIPPLVHNLLFLHLEIFLLNKKNVRRENFFFFEVYLYQNWKISTTKKMFRRVHCKFCSL